MEELKAVPGDTVFFANSVWMIGKVVDVLRDDDGGYLYKLERETSRRRIIISIADVVFPNTPQGASAMNDYYRNKRCSE